MSDKYSCINLGVIFPVNNIICFILRNFGMKKHCSVIKFSHFGFLSVAVNLDLFWINFGGTAEPRLCHP